MEESLDKTQLNIALHNLLKMINRHNRFCKPPDRLPSHYFSQINKGHWPEF